MSKSASRKKLPRRPPTRSKNVFTDIVHFLLHKPAISTLVNSDSQSERQNYGHRIIQRLDIDVNKYTILNIHKIGIEAPASYIFQDLMQWNGDSTCWPNHIANVVHKKNDLENINIYLFGGFRNPFKRQHHNMHLSGISLFNLKAIKVLQVPEEFDVDNGRYLLYDCSGGYPIGVFAMYVRSSIDEQQEKEQSQLFMIVGFNFYGRESLSKKRWINQPWELIHNRVSANIMNRFKQLCEWRFDKIQAG